MKLKFIPYILFFYWRLRAKKKGVNLTLYSRNTNRTSLI